MNELDYEKFYDKVGKTNGWDFSQMKCKTEEETWDFYQDVTKELKKSDVLLDIGTGGGESLLEIASSAMMLIGIDLSHSMVDTAQKNVLNSPYENAAFFQMNADNIQFPNQFFNVISCRHSPFSTSEVARVLKENGTFFTQQVSEHDKYNLMEKFGRGTIHKKDGELKNRYLNELKEIGFSEVKAYEYNVAEYYETEDDLIFLLTHTPIIPNFGKDKEDFKLLKQFIEENQTKKGIVTNSKRFKIVARK
ncbi:class I SAM-dependent methyltransferase [Chengkuizengella axinellae]|uniref:Class I SAM-dependent methyltransferase n=1 Tax=Chengkuizengella axinellae TaxID=3064388 RepID=A0ABT9IXE6_9BACL|nr:class I SAM-dependent methyltransferase [Chengkuizengella sp. 2205SS18-9]MDP5274043.1 class I SAM-dependent methyltransferase [Chengkuizengella sp. 2205SS18-9]